MKWVVVAGFLLCLVNSISCGALKKSDLLPGKECLPGTRWDSQCNQCTCSDDGTPTCTEKLCVGFENETSLRCLPDTIWKNECNTCWCTSTGHAMCTRIGCSVTIMNFSPTGSEPVKEDKVDEEDSSAPALRKPPSKAVVCAANRMFIKDCNTCWCNEDGTSYFCTRKVCVPDLPDETSEEPENASLVRKVRASPQANSKSEHKETPKNCQPGHEFRMDCNTCLCDNEGQNFSCTRMDCNALNNNNNGGARRKREVTTQVTIECTPGNVFQQGCKVCRCAQDGRHAICPTHCQNEKQHSENDISNTDSDPSFRCNPGEQFKRSCNDCSCSADGRSFFCTLRFCDEEIKEIAPVL